MNNYFAPQHNGVYPYYGAEQSARVVEETVTETFDDEGKLVSRVKKTVTKYETVYPYYQQLFSVDENNSHSINWQSKS